MSNTALVSNVYFTCEAYNDLVSNIPAEQDTNLLYPLIPNGESQNYQLGVVKARVPLGTIPLTRDNIDLKKYQLMLRNGVYEASAYVKQINALTGNYYYVLDGNAIKRYSYTATTSTLTKTISLSNICSFVLQFVVDDYENIYIAGSNVSNDVADTLFVLDSNLTPSIIFQQSFTNIKSIYIDRNSVFYVLDETEILATAYCYNNQNSLNSVQLSEAFTITQDFAGNNLNNVIFIVATENNIIIAHSQNILSYYTATGTPITDYISDASNLVCGNVLASEDVLCTVDSNLLLDQLIGTQSQVPYDIETGVALTTGVITSQLATAGTFAYAIGTDNHLYNTPWPITSPPGNFSPVNTSINLKTISARKNNVVAGISTTDDLYFLNQNIPDTEPVSDAWGLTAVNFKPSANGIISMDWNIANNKVLVVDSNNDLYLSNYGLYPLGYAGLTYNNNNVSVFGYESYVSTDGIMQQHLLSQVTPSTTIKSFATKNGVVYAVSGNPGSQIVLELSWHDWNTVINTYACAECAGTIRSITIVDNNFVCVGSDYNVAIYSIFTGVLVNNITDYVSDPSVMVEGFQDGSHIAIVHGVNSFDVWTYTGVPSSLSTNLVPGGTILAIAFNPNDITNGIGKIFISHQVSPTEFYIDSFTFIASYIADSQVTITVSITPYTTLFCNVDNGILIAYQPASTQVQLFYQLQNYSDTVYNQINNVPNYDYLYFPQSLTGYYTFQAITTNITPSSVAVSRTNPNTVYAINSANSKLYKGTLSSNAITFTQLSQFSQSYTSISTCKNTDTTNINSTLRTFTISNQTPINDVTLTNNKIESVAKNESNGQFLVGLLTSNQIKAYNSQLVVQSTLTQTNPYSLFAKNADDINVPNVSIYNLQVVIDSINAAFIEAWNKLKSLGGSLAEPPNLTIDFTGILTLNYSADYTQTGNAILFNNPLMNLCYFQNVPDSQDVGFYRLILKPSSTSTTQLSRSMYQFNQLDKILIQSTSLFVAGSWYGTNSVSQVLTDIDIPIDGSNFAIGNIGQVLYYQPPMLRVFQMGSGGNAVNRIQMSILYRYRNGTQYQLELAPGEAFSVKLDFIKKF